MKSISLINNSQKDMDLAFEPIGDFFSLPPDESVRLVIEDEEFGLDPDSIKIDFDLKDDRLCIKIWSERNAFEAFHKGNSISVI